MTGYETPAHRRQAAGEVLRRLTHADRVVIATHITPDPDALGSGIALAAWLRSLGAEARLVLPARLPERFRFLLPASGRLVASGAEARRLSKAADLAVMADASDLSRLGRLRPLIEKLPLVLVDHHLPAGDPPAAEARLVDPKACATAELVYDVLLSAGARWTRVIDNALYAAIVDDTGSFAFSNVTEGCHRIAAELVGRGVNVGEIHRQLYGSVELRRLQLLGACLGELRAQGGVSWITVPYDTYVALEATSDDIEGLVDYPRSVKGTEIALLFRTTHGGKTKVSLRSTGAADVDGIARSIGGGGHAKAAGALVGKPLAEVRTEVVRAARVEVGAG